MGQVSKENAERGEVQTHGKGKERGGKVTSGYWDGKRGKKGRNSSY